MKLPCDQCNGDGFVSFGDRHVENRKESCATCGGTGEIEARTGERPESSAPLAIPPGQRGPTPEVVRDPVVEAVRDDLLRRSQFGLAKYGTPLSRTDLDLRAWLNHAYEEALDFANYLKRSIIELDGTQAAGPPSNPAATPGVADSLRALSEAASEDWATNDATPYILGPQIDGEHDRFEVIARGPHGHAKSGDAIRKWQANRMFAVAAVNHVRALIAAQPAGQAGDAGANISGSVEVIERCVKLAQDAGLDSVTITGSVGHWQGILSKLHEHAPNSPRTGATETGAEEADASVPSHILAMAQAMADGRARAWESMRYGSCVPQHHSRSYWVMIAQDAYAVLAARPEAPVPPTPVIDVQPMSLSDGRKDYFVRVRCGDREQTLFKLVHRHEAQYTADELSWLLGLRPDKPDLLAYNETSHPND